MEYLTRYPKTLSFTDGKRHTVNIDTKGVEQFSVIVKKNVEELLSILTKEGFTKVKFEHVQDSQIGHGFSLKLKKPWEMHLRLFDVKKRVCRNTGRSRGVKGLPTTFVLPEDSSHIRNRGVAQKAPNRIPDLERQGEKLRPHRL
jgi:hypothetical protein